ncbi:MAG: DsbA family protein [Hyphomicrobiales bacterium]|nr:DsbA family protein [Hyphomicrobiales bacterium]
MAHIIQFVVLAGLLLVSPGMALGQDTSERLADRVLGAADAPVTMIEYSSLTCPHCADFHLHTLPQIKTAYIETGKVKLIFRDFPLDPRALAAAMVARCVDASRYYGFLDLLFRDQKTWATSDDVLHELKVRAQLALLPEEQFDACVQDRSLAQAIESRARQVREERGINSTPSFVIDDVLVRGAVPFERFQSVIDARLRGEDPRQTESSADPPETEPGFAGKVWNAVKRLWRSE